MIYMIMFWNYLKTYRMYKNMYYCPVLLISQLFWRIFISEQSWGRHFDTGQPSSVWVVSCALTVPVSVIKHSIVNKFEAFSLFENDNNN